MTNDANGWGEYRRLILDSLERIEDKQQQSERRLADIEKLIAELNGARKFAVWAGGLVGGAVVWAVSHVLKLVGKG